MSRMSEFEAEMQRLLEVDMAVRNYLSHLYEFEQGAGDGVGMDYWREQLEMLTSGESGFEVFDGGRFDVTGRPVEEAF